MLSLCALAAPMVVPVRRAITSGYLFARRRLTEPRVVCVRRKIYGYAALCVGLDV